MKKYFRGLLFFLLLFIKSLPVNSQTVPGDQLSAKARSAIEQLKTGVLILQLASNSEKLAQIQTHLKSPEINEKSRKRLEKVAKETLDETLIINSALVKVFKMYYTFSEVLFIYDKNTPSLKSVSNESFFLNSNLEIDPGIQLAGRSFLRATFGRRYNSPTASEVEGLQVLDSEFQELEKPFPSFTSQVKSFFQPLHSESYYKKLVMKFDKALIDFYELGKNPTP